MSATASNAAFALARAFFPQAGTLAVMPHGEHAAVIVRRVELLSTGAHLCGYAVVDHDPCPGVSLDRELEAPCHGGVTFDEVSPNGFRLVGFDCAHWGDNGDASLTPPKVLEDARALADWIVYETPKLAAWRAVEAAAFSRSAAALSTALEALRGAGVTP